MTLFKRNPFGHILWIKKFLIRTLGFISHGRYRSFNNLQIEGSEIIRQLPDTNVLFVSNHQTYFYETQRIMRLTYFNGFQKITVYFYITFLLFVIDFLLPQIAYCSDMQPEVCRRRGERRLLYEIVIKKWFFLSIGITRYDIQLSSTGRKLPLPR